MNIIGERLRLISALQQFLNKKLERKEQYLRKQEKLVQRCRNCSGASNGPWYCEDCTVGIRLQLLDAEYKDVNNWWKE